jgi:hypothetical protein
MSTLLSDLQSGPTDTDLVNQIMREMNGDGGAGGGGNMGAPPPPSPAHLPPNPGMIPAPSSNTAVAGHVMDNGPATAHMIGNSQPTPADFAAAMHGMNVATAYQPAGPPAAAAQQQQAALYAAAMAAAANKNSWSKKVAEEFKLPIVVAIIVFAFSLPVVNFLFAHYLPSMVLPTGQLTTIGLLIKSGAAGALFWILQRVIIPLLSI